jgi:sugar lactone lactonase YvrE/enterochelin esterase-like enzyme
MPSIRGLIIGFSGIVFLCAGTSLLAADDYAPGPDSLPHEGVPKGEVTKYSFDASRIFPGTTRDYWIYVPRQYDPAKPACLYVGQDGVQFKVPVVFDNLIARHEMPVTIGVFIMHGRVKAESTNALDRFNRSYEYDGLGDNYARFVLEEILPQVEKKTAADGRPIRISPNPNDHAIGGSSSGAICAFTAAWERPDAFRRVFSSIGTYVDQRGGNDYPALIRKTEAKPLRIFLQDGSNDLNKVGGNWFLANQEMLSAFEFAGYEVNHIWGEGGHNGKQATAIFPDAMRWLWKDWPKPVESGYGSNQPVAQVLVRGEPWKVVGTGYGNAGGLAVNAQGDVFFSDAAHSCIRKIGLDGGITVFVEQKGAPPGLMFGQDGRLYSAFGRVIAYDSPKSKGGVIVDHDAPWDARALCIGHNGNIYVADRANKRVWLVDDRNGKRVVDTGISCSGICLSPDQSLLLASVQQDQFIYSFHINSDGTLSDRQPYHHLRIPDGAMESGAAGMAVDQRGILYVATLLGIQMCDQAGRVQGIISAPRGVVFLNIAFGGANFDEMFASGSGQIFRRKLKTTGALSFQAPIKPAAPSL